MGVIIFTAVLFIVSTTLAIIDKRRSWCGTWLGCFTTAISILTFITLAVSGVYFCSKPYEEKEAIAQYNNLREQAKFSFYDEIVTKDNIRNQILKMNNRIDRNNVHKDNWVIGWYFFKEFATLEKIEWVPFCEENVSYEPQPLIEEDVE